MHTQKASSRLSAAEPRNSRPSGWTECSPANPPRGITVGFSQPEVIAGDAAYLAGRDHCCITGAAVCVVRGFGAWATAPRRHAASARLVSRHGPAGSIGAHGQTK